MSYHQSGQRALGLIGLCWGNMSHVLEGVHVCGREGGQHPLHQREVRAPK